MANPICFFLDKDCISDICKKRILDKVREINPYIRCFTLNLYDEELDNLQNQDERMYLLNLRKENLVSARDPEGEILCESAYSAMIAALKEHLQGNNRYDANMHFLVHSCLRTDFLVTNDRGRYKSALAIMEGSVLAIPKEKYYEHCLDAGWKTDELYEKTMAKVVQDIKSLKVVDPIKFQELLSKLVEYSVDRNAELPNDFLRTHNRIENGESNIRSLEESMRPGRLSKGWFLGPNESLEAIIREDDDTVKKLGLTHEQIANGIEYLMNESLYESRYYKNKNRLPSNYVIEVIHYMGFQECPWSDSGEHGSVELRITNKRLGETIFCPGLIVHLIRKHHFFEGKQSPYRVDPEKVVRVLEISQKHLQ